MPYLYASIAEPPLPYKTEVLIDPFPAIGLQIAVKALQIAIVAIDRL